MEEETDERLAVLSGGRDHRAFSVLVKRHADRFYRTAWRMTSNAAEAEEIVQEAFLRLWEKPDAWKPGKGAKFTTWFTRIVINLAIDRSRRKRGRDAEMPDASLLADDTQDSESHLIRDERQDSLEKAVMALPVRQRAALNLCYYEGMGNAEAAKALGVGVKALESLLSRAKSGVKTRMTEEGYG